MSKQLRGRPSLWAAVAIPAFLIIVSAGAPAGNQEVPRPGGVLRVGAMGEGFQPRLDPALGDYVFITQQIFDGLFRLDADLKVVPELAEYWIPSDGGRRHTYFLRKGVRFHHGREVTSADVKFSFERLLRKETRSPYTAFFAPRVVGAAEFADGRAADVAGFRALDKYIFEIEWRSPYVSALSLLSLSFCRVLPKELVEGRGRDFFFRPVGTGPFAFDSWIRSPKLEILGVRLIRNPDYFGRKAILDAIEFSPFYTIEQFLNRDVAVMPYLSSDLARTGCRVLEGGPLNVGFLMMSCGLPPFDRARVRRALALALDKDRIVQSIASDAFIRKTANNFIPVKLRGFPPMDGPGGPDPGQARRILEEEGFFSGREFPDVSLYFALPVESSHARIFREIADQLEAVGLSLSLKHYRTAEELRGVREPYLVYVEWVLDFPDAESVIRPLFSGGSALNQYDSPELQRLLGAAEVEPSQKARIGLFREIEKVLAYDLPAVPIFTSEQLVAVQPYVREARIPPLGFPYLNVKEIWLDR